MNRKPVMRAAAYVADPYAYYRGLRAQAPACWNPDVNAWTLTRYSDVMDLIRHPALSVGRLPLAQPVAGEGRRGDMLEQHLAHWLIRMDGPDHARLRALAKRGMPNRFADQMRPLVRQRAAALLGKLLSGAAIIDVISDYAAPLALAAICDALGLPEQDHAQFRHWSECIEQGAGRGCSASQVSRAIEAVQATRAYLAQQVGRVQASGLISAFAGSSVNGAVMSRDEVISTASLLLLAGHETSTHALANALLALFDHPSELEKLRHGDCDTGAIDELLRYDTPLQGLMRRATACFEWQGQRVSVGQTLVLWLGSANRDPAVFAEPDRLNLNRQALRHASFGFGAHRCLGAGLAHCILEEGLLAFLAAAPKAVRLARSLEWRGNMLFRSQTRLLVQLY
ncbi:cytochrome P450 [Bradyrhizobium sp. STM 3843]|uniref:cytochrome P450 n=1 Tax=Bradyrhizobium sp. STM 3843 TaxID=551947 RepID=UPI0002E69228|nr:cytochrome P450 [Bradyrhizobium sp. STM 3843]